MCFAFTNRTSSSAQFPLRHIGTKFGSVGPYQNCQPPNFAFLDALAQLSSRARLV